MNYLDYVLLGIIIISAFVALKRGLIKSLFGLCSTVLGAIIAYFLYVPISGWMIKNTGLYHTIQQKVSVSLKLDQVAQSAITKQDEMNVINNLKVPGFIKDMLTANYNAEVEKLLDATGLKEYISGAIATIAINALAFVVVLIVATILIHILSGALNIVAKLPVVHQLNQLGGLIIGLIWGIFLVWIVCVLLSFISGYQESGKLLEMIESSKVTKFFYENNFMLNFLSDFTKTLLR